MGTKLRVVDHIILPLFQDVFTVVLSIHVHVVEEWGGLIDIPSCIAVFWSQAIPIQQRVPIACSKEHLESMQLLKPQIITTALSLQVLDSGCVIMK
jgi:hypothetical protein